MAPSPVPWLLPSTDKSVGLGCQPQKLARPQHLQRQSDSLMPQPHPKVIGESPQDNLWQPHSRCGHWGTGQCREGPWAAAAGEASTPELRVQLFPREAQPGVAEGQRCDGLWLSPNTHFISDFLGVITRKSQNPHPKGKAGNSQLQQTPSPHSDTRYSDLTAPLATNPPYSTSNKWHCSPCPVPQEPLKASLPVPYPRVTPSPAQQHWPYQINAQHRLTPASLCFENSTL